MQLIYTQARTYPLSRKSLISESKIRKKGKDNSKFREKTVTVSAICNVNRIRNVSLTWTRSGFQNLDRMQLKDSSRSERDGEVHIESRRLMQNALPHPDLQQQSFSIDHNCISLSFPTNCAI